MKNIIITILLLLACQTHAYNLNQIAPSLGDGSQGNLYIVSPEIAHISEQMKEKMGIASNIKSHKMPEFTEDEAYNNSWDTIEIKSEKKSEKKSENILHFHSVAKKHN